jgi:major membrane immunogen (membrane-anchored lipoprotein)
MISLVGLLDKYIFAGVPSNAAYDLLKAAWGKAHAKSWEASYVESFQQAVKDEAKTLAKYTGRGGEVELNDAELAKALHRDLAVDPAILPFSALSDSEFAARLGKAMAERSVLVIGGHNLSPDDYAQLVRNLVQHARARFKSAILADENAFRKALFEEASVTQATVDETQSLVGEVQTYLVARFDLVLGRLDEIGADVKDIKRALTAKPPLQKSVPQHATVVIGSTARDLPEHRKEVVDACLRQGMFPMMMEHLPASDADAIEASLQMVDEADIYLGVLAHRYGYVPKGHDISVTEMEYNRAVERKIPRLLFVMDKEHPITIDDVEMGEGAVKLEAFKKRLLAENVVNFFKSPADLRAHVINSLSQLRKPDLTAFHYVSDIPAPPEAYIAHPYTLLQTHRLIGRQVELNLTMLD